MRGRPAYFNAVAATMRYQVEQAIGILKSRWTILRSLPLRLRTTHDQALAHGIIVACVILHNLVVNTDDEALDDDEYTDAEAVMQHGPVKHSCLQTSCASPNISSGERGW